MAIPEAKAAAAATDPRLSLVNAYLGAGIDSVPGWCDPRIWYAIWPLHALIGDGPVAEIGVFRGRFFIGLAKTFGVGAGVRATAIDVFEMQEFNLDNAGKGEAAAFVANLAAHGVDPAHVDLMQVDSLSLRAAERAQFVAERGRVAFFSVDGCHEVNHTTQDIEFAMEVTRHNGVIAVDDYLHPFWPGVQEAVAKMYLSREYPFVPLAVIGGKLLLCSQSFHKTYLAAIVAYVRAHCPGAQVKICTRFGYRTASVRVEQAAWVPLVPAPPTV